jgi:hypothetical protein
VRSKWAVLAWTNWRGLWPTARSARPLLEEE